MYRVIENSKLTRSELFSFQKCRERRVLVSRSSGFGPLELPPVYTHSPSFLYSLHLDPLMELFICCSSRYNCGEDEAKRHGTTNERWTATTADSEYSQRFTYCRLVAGAPRGNNSRSEIVDICFKFKFPFSVFSSERCKLACSLKFR